MNELKAKLFRISELLVQLHMDSFAHNQSKVNSGIKIITNLLNMAIDECKSQLPNPCTPEQYEQITGEKFPDDGVVWYKGNAEIFSVMPLHFANKLRSMENNDPIYIVQTGKPSPPVDWKPE